MDSQIDLSNAQALLDAADGFVNARRRNTLSACKACQFAKSKCEHTECGSFSCRRCTRFQYTCEFGPPQPKEEAPVGDEPGENHNINPLVADKRSACLTCRKIKAKCEPTTSGPVPCRRCVRLGCPCLVGEDGRHRAKAKRKSYGEGGNDLGGESPAPGLRSGPASSTTLTALDGLAAQELVNLGSSVRVAGVAGFETTAPPVEMPLRVPSPAEASRTLRVPSPAEASGVLGLLAMAPSFPAVTEPPIEVPPQPQAEFKPMMLKVVDRSKFDSWCKSPVGRAFAATCGAAGLEFGAAAESGSEGNAESDGEDDGAAPAGRDLSV